MNLEENEQRIINEAIISENLTVQDIREITKHSKLNKRKKGIVDELIGKESDGRYPDASSNTDTDANNDQSRQRSRLSTGQISDYILASIYALTTNTFLGYHGRIGRGCNSF
jgi:hypothetical protein